MAWGNEALARSAVQSALTSTLTTDPGAVGNEQQALAVLDSAGVREEQWRERRAQSDVRRRMQDATARALATGRGGRDPQSPVFVVDGVYRIDGGNEGGIVAAFQILNWVVARQLTQ